MQARVDAGIITDTASLIKLGDQAGRLNLDFRAGARSVLAGAQLSRFRGRGMDFAESREYNPGDDVRHIDWRVTARTGKAHTKLYTEERERPVFVISDFSSSMYFGTRGCFKSVTAARAAAIIAWSVVAAGDRIGGVVATADAVIDMRPGQGRRGVLGLLNALAEATMLTTNTASHAANQLPPEADEQSLFEQGLKHATRVIHPGSLIILLSDFYGVQAESQQLLTNLLKHNDVVACQILDPLECQMPRPGNYMISDGVSKAPLDLSVKRRREDFVQLMNNRQQRIHELLSHCNIPLIQLLGGGDMNTSLAQAFGGVKAKRRRRNNS